MLGRGHLLQRRILKPHRCKILHRLLSLLNKSVIPNDEIDSSKAPRRMMSHFPNSSGDALGNKVMVNNLSACHVPWLHFAMDILLVLGSSRLVSCIMKKKGHSLLPGSRKRKWTYDKEKNSESWRVPHPSQFSLAFVALTPPVGPTCSSSVCSPHSTTSLTRPRTFSRSRRRRFFSSLSYIFWIHIKNV